MKHRVSIIAVLLMVMIVPKKVIAHDFSAVAPSGQTLYYSINGTEATVTALASGAWNIYGDLIIPDSVTYNSFSYPVTRIGYYAFGECSGLLSVTIPNTVRTIESYAFYECSSLHTITIGSGVISIGQYAFAYCNSASRVNYTGTITQWCNIKFDYDNSNPLRYAHDLYINNEKIVNLVIPNDVSAIKQYSFMGASIVSVDVGESVDTIGWCSFSYCTLLDSIVFHNSLVSIQGKSFRGCSNLRTIIIPSHTTEIQDEAFGECSNLSCLIIGDSVSYIGAGAFVGCSGLSKIHIPKAVTCIGIRAFESCALDTIIVNEDNPIYDSRNNCNAIIETASNTLVVGCKNTIIPSSIISIGDRAFADVKSLKTIIIPDSVLFIGTYAFGACDSLKDVSIGKSVSVIGNSSFSSYYAAYNMIINCKASYPPNVSGGIFTYMQHPVFFVPCESVDAYQSSTFWSNYSNSIYGKNFWEHSYSFIPNMDTYGFVRVDEPDCDSNLLITACANTGYQFLCWSDGVIENPRIIHLLRDTSIIAFFDYVPYSVIGQLNDTTRGIIYGSDTVHYSDTVTLFAIANYGYHFTQWNDGDTSNPRQVQVTRDSVFTAQFDFNQYGIALSVDTTIHGSVSGAGSYNYLSERTITATANYGYHFTQWSDGDTNNPRVITLTQDTDFTALFAKNTYSITALSADTVKGYAGGTCTLEYLDTAILTATANYGYHFTQWSDGNTANPRLVQVTRDSVFTAQFDYNQYGIALSVDTTIHGSVSGAGVYNYLSEHTINATPNYGYHFTQWSDGDTNNPRTLTLTQDTAFTALFAKNTYSITALSADTMKGYAGGAGTLEYLDTATLTATANYGYHFTMWNDGNTDNPRQVQVTRDSVFTAQFDYNQYSIALAVDSTIHGTVNGAGSYNYLSSRTISATANCGYHFATWSDGVTDNPRTLTLTKDTSLVALFSISAYNIIAISANSTMGTASVGAGRMDYLDTITLTATPNYGYHFTQWSDGNTDNPRMVQVTCDSVFTAQFDYNQYSIALAVDTTIHGSVSGAGSYNYLSERSITATANYGYHFTQWSDGDTNNPRVITLTQDTVFTALFAKNTYSITALSADTVKGYAGGTDTLEYLDTATLIATANYGFHFTQWSDGNTANPRMVQVTRDSVFTAQFDYNQYGITLAVDATIHGSVSGEGSYNYLSERTISATPNYGYHFTQWSDGDTNNPRVITLTQDTAFTALFTANQYYVTATCNDTARGSVWGSDSVAYLDTITLIAVTNYGYHLNYWRYLNDNGSYVTLYSIDTIQLEVTRNMSVTAYFTYNQYSISLSVDTAIHGTVNGAGSYNYLSARTITATPNYGYHFTQWDDGDTTNPRTITLRQDTVFTALFTKNLYDVAVLSADTIRGNVTGSTTAEYLDILSLTATSNYGYHFTQWNDGDTNNPRTFTLTQDTMFTALFAKNSYDIALSVDTVIHGSVTGAGTYEYLDSRTLAAIANYGYHFTQWSDGDTNNPRVITLTQDTSFTALFAKNLYDVAVLSADTIRGSVTGSTTTEYLDTVSISAAANYGYHFTAWNDGNTDNPRVITLTQDTAFTALFAKNTYSITALSADTVKGYAGGTGTLEYLDTATLTATANYGYHFTQWSDGDTNNPRVITLTQDTAFTALFAKNQYRVILTVNDTALGMITGDGIYNYLDTVTLTATCTAEHHHFVRWSDGITDASRTIILVSDTTITALFAIDTHNVALTVNDDLFGSVSGMGNYPYGTEVAIEATANEGYHFAEWSNGSRENPTIITLVGDTALTAIFTDNVVPQICMVTVQDGRNILMWEKGMEVQRYNVYREGMVAGEYELAASVPYDSLSMWVDTTSRPRTRSYRYRMTATDIFGIESEPSEIHKTMHLTINQGIGNEWNLVWSEYEGAEYSTYVIYRGTDAGNIQQIDVMPAGGNTTYTDENAPTGEVYYQVGILLNTPCNPTKSSEIVRSNIATNATVGIRETIDTDNIIRVYSKNGCIHVSKDGQTVKEFYVYDVMGREVYHARHENHTSTLPEGVYLVKVGIYPARKVVVIR